MLVNEKLWKENKRGTKKRDMKSTTKQIFVSKGKKFQRGKFWIVLKELMILSRVVNGASSSKIWDWISI
jgi:hypothetical protein